MYVFDPSKKKINGNKRLNEPDSINFVYERINNINHVLTGSEPIGQLPLENIDKGPRRGPTLNTISSFVKVRILITSLRRFWV